MLRGDWRIVNFVIASLYGRNFIPAIKVYAVSNTAKIEFFSYFLKNKGSLWVFRGTCIVANFFYS